MSSRDVARCHLISETLNFMDQPNSGLLGTGGEKWLNLSNEAMKTTLCCIKRTKHFSHKKIILVLLEYNRIFLSTVT